MKNLTVKQELFVVEWIRLRNKTQAYINIYDAEDMKYNTAKSKAWGVSELEHVKARYNERLEEMIQETKWDFVRANHELQRTVTKSYTQSKLGANVAAIRELNLLNDLYPKQEVSNISEPVEVIVTEPIHTMDEEEVVKQDEN